MYLGEKGEKDKKRQKKEKKKRKENRKTELEHVVISEKKVAEESVKTS